MLRPAAGGVRPGPARAPVQHRSRGAGPHRRGAAGAVRHRAGAGPHVGGAGRACRPADRAQRGRVRRRLPGRRVLAVRRAAPGDGAGAPHAGPARGRRHVRGVRCAPGPGRRAGALAAAVAGGRQRAAPGGAVGRAQGAGGLRASAAAGRPGLPAAERAPCLPFAVHAAHARGLRGRGAHAGLPAAAARPDLHRQRPARRPRHGRRRLLGAPCRGHRAVRRCAAAGAARGGRALHRDRPAQCADRPGPGDRRRIRGPGHRRACGRRVATPPVPGHAGARGGRLRGLAGRAGGAAPRRHGPAGAGARARAAPPALPHDAHAACLLAGPPCGGGRRAGRHPHVPGARCAGARRGAHGAGLERAGGAPRHAARHRAARRLPAGAGRGAGRGAGLP